MTITAQSAPVGARGFDTNTVVRPSDAKRFVDNGYTFAIRYVPRETAHANDITRAELRVLLEAGLGVMLVQHVESETMWMPSDDKAKVYGRTAAAIATEVGYPKSATLWLDLEGVSLLATADLIARYCNGWHSGLTGDQLYRRLRAARFWSAFNLNADQRPAVRGVCMQQRVERPPEGVPFPIDGDLVTGDKLGGLPTLAAPFTPLPG
jgi:hypothetical protein